METVSTKSLALRHMPSTLRSLEDMLAYLLIELFLGDVITYVWKSFGNAIEAQCDDEDPRISRKGKARMKAYKRWSNLTYPLGFDGEIVRVPSRRQRDDPTNDCWKLLGIIAGAKTNEGLKLIDEGWKTEDLGKKMIGMTNPTRRRVEAPLIYGGLLYHTLPLAQDRLLERSRNATGREDTEVALGKALGRAMAARRIEFAPYHGPPQGQSNRYAADPQWWIKIRRSTATIIVIEDSDSDENEAVAEANRCPTAPWNLPSGVEGMIPFLEKTVLPREWSLVHANLGVRGSLPDWIIDTYEWVEQNYDGQKVLHRMALLWSILLTQLLPRIGVGATSIPTIDTTTEATTAILNLDWVEPPRKGLKSPLPFIVMLTCVIIAYFEAESPLRRHLADNDNHLGDPWNLKHGVWTWTSDCGVLRTDVTMLRSEEVHQCVDVDTDEPGGSEKVDGAGIASVQG